MKFIHISDILIGNTLESGTRWEAERNDELSDNLEKLLVIAEEENINLLMISGGLFSHVPTTRDLEKAAEIFAGHMGISVIITAGYSDCITDSSPVLSFEWPSNVSYVGKEGVQRIVLGRIHTEVYAASVFNRLKVEETEMETETLPLSAVDPLSDTTNGSGDREPILSLTDEYQVPALGDYLHAADGCGEYEAIRIAMLPDTEDETVVRVLGNSAFSYIAAGGAIRGGKREIIKGMAYRPGRFEPADENDTGSHGAMKGEIPLDTGKLANLSFVPLASASYVTLGIKVTTDTTSDSLRASVAREIERLGTNNIYRLRLYGERVPGTELELEDIKRKFRIKSIVDETEPWYDFDRMFREHSQDMIGFYISTVAGRTEDMSKTEKKAMFYGIDALIKTASN